MSTAIDFVKQKLAEAGFEVLPPNPEMTAQYEYVLLSDDQGRQQAVYITAEETKKFGLDFVSLLGISYYGPESGLDPQAYLLVSEGGLGNTGHWDWMRLNPETIIVGYGVDIPVSDSLDAMSLGEVLVEIGTQADRGEQILTSGGDRF